MRVSFVTILKVTYTVSGSRSSTASREMAREVCHGFGGTAFTNLSVLFDARPGEGHHIGERLEPRNLANSEPAHVVDKARRASRGRPSLIVGG